MNDFSLRAFIENAIKEDTGQGDHTTLACVPQDITGRSKLIVKDNGVIAGVDVACEILRYSDENIKTEVFKNDGDNCYKGEIAFIAEGNAAKILQAERLILNIMQRMSGIATVTRQYVKTLEGLKTKILDTRKTTPGFRYFEKEAVRIGGGHNHRFGLYDMILIKDNHIDFSGGIVPAIKRTRNYLDKTGLNLKVEIEARNPNDVEIIVKTGGVDRIMLDNFTVEDTLNAVKTIAGKYETESSGGITLQNIRKYAECGVDFISVGALTHNIKSLDLSLKAF